ncbi:MAG TPA: formate dehydrogenase accessory sulfurtransferase FdhD [Acidimicrobiales bacterium]|jgi:FdhD protein|nr:formate dehydrogenase accessory sulfurtransferase FdhD [Acidimicrobiales bacterium]
MPGASVPRPLLRIEGDTRRISYDAVAAEEPLEIRVNGRAMAVTMRTPGHDFELAAGFLLTEGVVDRGDQVRAMRYCGPGPAPGRPDPLREFNVVDVAVSDDAPAADVAPRAVFTSSSCGLCGRASISSVRSRAPLDVAGDPMRLSVEVLAGLPDRLRAAQAVFARTGGLHAAGLFDAGGTLVCAREDVGRHNAFDKVIGWAAMHRRLPLRSHVLMASGRASFELVQKALIAGAPALAAVSAPSSLAVELAEEAGMTLVGFLRGDTMNVYAGGDRLVGA